MIARLVLIGAGLGSGAVAQVSRMPAGVQDFLHEVEPHWAEDLDTNSFG
jgi:hypothetical protein